MKNYIGAKIIKAEPMTRNAFTNRVKNEDVPKNQDDEPGYYVEYPNGYRSWSPKDVFEEAYREISGHEIALMAYNASSVETPIHGTSTDG